MVDRRNEKKKERGTQRDRWRDRAVCQKEANTPRQNKLFCKVKHHGKLR